MEHGLDAEVFEALYLELERPLFNIVYRWVWAEQEARDLVQEAFVKLWERRDRVDEELARGYIYRTAVNLASNRLRAKRLWRMSGGEALGGLLSRSAGGEHRLLANERQAAVRRAVLSLPERHRRVLVLCRFAEMSHAEVGALLGIPEGTVASRDHRARVLLKQRLADCAEDESWT